MRIYFDGPYIILAGVFLILIVLFMIYKIKTTIYFNIFFILFYIYIFQLIKYTQFPIVYIPDLIDRNSIMSQINYIPFSNITKSPTNAFLNVILTMPFGFLLPFVKRIHSKKNILIWAIVLPVLIEGLQLIIALLTGYTERIIDVNDIIFNFTGVILGFWIFKRFIYFLKIILNENEWTKNNFLKYISNTINF